MSVIPVGAVLEMARTGTFACCASGSAALAVFESVGPRMALTRSRLMNFWKTVMPCSLVDASSSISTLSFGPPPPVTCSTPAWMPARCKAPYEAAAPVRLSAAPIVAPPPDAGASEPWSLHAAARSSNRENDHRRARLMGSPSRRGMLRYRKRRGFARLAGCARRQILGSLLAALTSLPLLAQGPLPPPHSFGRDTRRTGAFTGAGTPLGLTCA